MTTPTIHVNDAGIWKPVRALYINDAGVWKTIKSVFVNVAGVWTSVFENETIFISKVFATRQDGGSPAEYYLNANGNIDVRQGSAITSGAGTWTNYPANASAYECRATVTSGTLTTGTAGTWLSLGTTRSWVRAAGVGTSQQVVLTLEIRRAADSVVVETKTVTITCDRT